MNIYMKGSLIHMKIVFCDITDNRTAAIRYLYEN